MNNHLTENKEITLSLLRQIPGNYLILLPNYPLFTILEASDEYCQTTYTDRDSIIGKTLFEVFPDNPAVVEANGAANLLESLLTAINTRKSQQMAIQRYDIRLSDFAQYETKYWLSVNKPILIEDEVAFIVHTTEDITENRLLKISETYFRALADESPIMIWRCVNGECNYVNNRWTRITGLTLEESLGLGYQKAFHPDDRDEQAALYLHAIRTHAVYHAKFRILNKAGETRWVINRASPHFVDGCSLEYIGSMIDITEDELARRKLEESEMQLQQLTDSIVQLVWVTDPAGMHFYYNQRWYDFTGATREESAGERWISLFHPDDREQAWAKWEHSLATGDIYEIEYRLRNKEGEYIWMLGRAAPIYNMSGKIVSWFGTCTDIHSQKMLQKQKEEFITIVSHELKTPLTSILGNLQLLERQMEREEHIGLNTLKLAETASNHAKRLSRLVNDLLDVTRIENGQLILNKTSFKLSDLLDVCCESYLSRGHVIKVTGDTQLVVYADYSKIEQVLTNLVNNAVKYAEGSKEILINYQKVASDIMVSVQDFGPGIAKEKLAHLFNIYYRADTDGRQYSGLGLGLYICSRIVSYHRGSIGVESKIGEGSTFWFLLPLE